MQEAELNLTGKMEPEIVSLSTAFSLSPWFLLCFDFFVFFPYQWVRFFLCYLPVWSNSLIFWPKMLESHFPLSHSTPPTSYAKFDFTLESNSDIFFSQYYLLLTAQLKGTLNCCEFSVHFIFNLQWLASFLH